MKVRNRFKRLKEKIFDFLCVNGIEHAIVVAYLARGWRDFFKPIDRRICHDIYANQKAFFGAVAGYLAFWTWVIKEARANRRQERETLELLRECERQRHLDNVS